MAEPTLPQDAVPLTPLGYYRESLSLFQDMYTQTWRLAINQMNAFTEPEQNRKQTETPANAFICAISDMNLRHWQNTSRFLDNFPSWFRQPGMVTGIAMVDWFDRRQNRQTIFGLAERNADQTPGSQKPANRPSVPTPQTASSPGPGRTIDDLALIRGIGPKLSQRLNAMGICQFQQIADWNVSQAVDIDQKLACKGRILREDWRGQARKLLQNRQTGPA